MKVFHGSTEVVKHPLTSVGRKNLDFGEGFYVTDIREQAISWASRPINKGNQHWLNIYELDIEKAINDFRYIKFPTYDFNWFDFVVANRLGEELWKEFDIVEGGIANDRVFNTIELFIAGLTPREDALEQLRFEKPNNQICLISQELINRCLKFVSAEKIDC